MSNAYFNKIQFVKALDLMESDPVESKRQFVKYIHDYPLDFNAYPYYVSILITLGEIENALKVIDKVDELIYRMGYDKQEKYHHKYQIFREKMLFANLRLLSYQEKYSELYRLINHNRDLIANLDIHQISFYCVNKLDLIREKKVRDAYSYSFRQILDYQEEDFLEHIKKHLADCNIDNDRPNQNMFAADFPIYDVIEEIKKYIPSEKRIFRGFFTNVYTFKYSDCGRDNNRITDYFNVVCFHNTDKIITMCPSFKCDKLPYVDLNYMKHTDEDVKVKKRSQIDKFNARYNIKSS